MGAEVVESATSPPPAQPSLAPNEEAEDSRAPAPPPSSPREKIVADSSLKERTSLSGRSPPTASAVVVLDAPKSTSREASLSSTHDYEQKMIKSRPQDPPPRSRDVQSTPPPVAPSQSATRSSPRSEIETFGSQSRSNQPSESEFTVVFDERRKMRDHSAQPTAVVPKQQVIRRDASVQTSRPHQTAVTPKQRSADSDSNRPVLVDVPPPHWCRSLSSPLTNYIPLLDHAIRSPVNEAWTLTTENLKSMREGFGVRDCGEGANVEVTEAMRDLGVSVAKMTKMLQTVAKAGQASIATAEALVYLEEVRQKMVSMGETLEE